MSHLNSLRLVFAGDFQADTATVNNDIRHYDNATFEPRFQEFQEETPRPGERNPVMNGWWNPMGSSAFRLIDCTVRSVFVDDQEITDDPAMSLVIGGSNTRAGAKMVDIDPQFQLGSALWGLTIRLTDGEHDFLVGQFKPSSFRDIVFSRREQGGAGGGSDRASAVFQSVLTDLEWSNNLLGSSFLQELQAASAISDKLSIRLTTFGYTGSKDDPRFTLGTVIGAIGPYIENEPNFFVRGRRMVPEIGDSGSPNNNINFFDGWVDQDNSSVFVDLGNSLPLTVDLGLQDIGNIQLAILKDESIEESATLTTEQQYELLDPSIPYQTSDWLYKTAGIYSAPLQTNQLTLIQNHPLALVEIVDGSTLKVLVRESKDGLFVRADEFLQRAEPGNSVQVELFASRYGNPLTSTQVRIDFSRSQLLNNGGATFYPDHPTAEIPPTDIPQEALTNLTPWSPGAHAPTEPATILTTDSDGKAILSITTQDPGNPRDYIDGQLYTLQYSLTDQENNQKHFLDAIYLLLFDAYPIPFQPTWLDHIQPIFQQYGNLYPIMSKRLVDLGDYDSVVQHRAILTLAFSLDIYDSNSMPVTRDLSANKRVTILKWLLEQSHDGRYVMRLGRMKATTKAPAKIQQEQEELRLESSALEPTADSMSTVHGYQQYLMALERNRSDS